MEYFIGNNEAGKYLHMTGRKIGLYRRTGLIKAVRSGHSWLYSVDELDRFMKDWSGYSLRNEEEIMCAKRMRNNDICEAKRTIHEA